MKSKLLTMSLGGALLLCAFAVQTQAQQKADPLSGKYEGKITGQQFGTLVTKLELKSSGKSFSGTMEVPETPHGAMKGTITGTIEEGKITAKFDLGMFKGDVTATLKGDSISGTWKGDEGDGPIIWKKS